MSEAMYTATSGALAYQMRLEILANNLANINTIGFKEDRTIFRSYLPDPVDPTGQDIQETLINNEIVSPYLLSNTLVVFEGTEIDFSSGHLKHTGNPLNLALEGNGFFTIETPEGVQYTRNGNFALNGEGLLVTQEGLTVLGEGGEIKIDGEDFLVDKEGNISVDGKQVDTLRIVDFAEPRSLEKVGNSLFASVNPTPSEITAEGFTVNQGFLELSNVEPIRVMTEMLEVLRGYESYQKVIQSVDEVTSKAIDEVGQVV